eukprot:8621497-Alexandrium_andersonii.AAC.1
MAWAAVCSFWPRTVIEPVEVLREPAHASPPGACARVGSVGWFLLAGCSTFAHEPALAGCSGGLQVPCSELQEPRAAWQQRRLGCTA